MLIAGGALRTMRLVNKATSNYHVDAQHACAARYKVGNFANRLAGIETLAKKTALTRPHRLQAIDATSGHDF